jgi:signal transduction histidine kinase
MASIIEQILSLFLIPQGNLIYAVVLAICAFSAWLACIYAKGNVDSTSGWRMQLGLLFLFLVQLLLIITSWFAWLGVIDTHAFLPPIDRALAIFSLVLIIWLWAIPEPSKIWDAVVALAEIFVVLFGAAGLVLWLREGAQVSFDTSALGAYAYYAGLGLLVVGIILLPVRHPRYWGYGLAMLLIMLAGYLIQIMVSQPAADYAWFIHVGEMLAFLLLLLLPKRLVSLAQVKPALAPPKSAQLNASRLDGKLIQAIAEVVTEPSPQKYYQELVSLVAHVMNAEACLLMIPPKAGEQIIMPIGCNVLQGQNLAGFTADGSKMPTLLEAVKNGASLRLAGGPSTEGQLLSEELGIKHTSHLLVAPFYPKGTSALMSIAVLSGLSMPEWSEADAAQLKDVTDSLIANHGMSSVAGKPADIAEMQAKIQRAEALSDQVRLEYAQLKARYDSISSQVAGSSTQAENEMALQADIQRLENRNHELETLLARGRPSMEEVEQLRQELRAALADLARIPSTLSRSDQKMLETQLSAVKRLDKLQPTELVTSIAEEFRQPLSSIVGYTDLLLGESVGLLGAVQRKFLERVKASTERLRILMDELVEVVTIDGGKVDKTPVSVQLELVLRKAAGNIAAQLNEKNIHIALELAETLPSIRANEDALLQILDNLLENACVVTPADGTIKLAAGVEEREEGQNFALISVTDQGGGIERTDISRVFLRRYKEENPLIKGVGDAGVGLSIVKSLVELLKGRVWVDSHPEGSTFSVLLPLAEAQASPKISNNSANG